MLSKNSGDSSNNNNGDAQNNNNNNNNNNNAGGSEDYGDKGLDFLEKKTGYTQSRDTNEKITDGARGLYEKATGNQVDSKYSN